jgi:ABC-2 type transport system ATP-binding protein
VPDEPGLSLDAVTKRYSTFALQSVSGNVPPGTVIALVGRNGAGKTTLLKTVFGLLSPDSGRVTLNHRVIIQPERTDGLEAKLRIGYLPDEGIFYEWMTVSRLLRFCRAFHPMWRDSRAKTLLEKFELDPRKQVGELSRGMRVKLGLIISLAHEPEALLLDEPLSGLDPLSRKTTMEQIRSIVTESRCCCLISSHDLEDVRKMSDGIWVLRAGRMSLKARCSAPDTWELSGGEPVEDLFETVCAAM